MTEHGDKRRPGDDTRDLRQAVTIHPRGDETPEQLTQRRGNRLLAAGFTTIALTLMLSLGVSMAYNDTPFPNPDAKIFGNLVFVTLMVTGATLVAVSLNERIHRRGRAEHLARAAAAHERADQLYLLLQRHIIDTDEPLQVIMGTLSVNTGRLSAMEDSLTALVEALPREIQRRYWEGFNDAVKEGFSEQTGTDGNHKRRPGHLGLVPPNDEDQD